MKKRSRIALSLCTVLLLSASLATFAFSQNAQAAQGNAGAWVLVDARTFVGDKSLGSGETALWTDNSVTITHSEKVTHDELWNQGYDSHEEWTAQMAWTDPQSTIALGNEESLSLTLDFALGDMTFEYGKDISKDAYATPTVGAEITLSFGYYYSEGNETSHGSSETQRDSWQYGGSRYYALAAWPGFSSIMDTNLQPAEAYTDPWGQTGPSSQMWLWATDRKPVRATWHMQASALQEAKDIANGKLSVGDLSYDHPDKLGMVVCVANVETDVHRVYYYEYDSQAAAPVAATSTTVNTTASDNPGEDDEGGIPIPAIIALGALLAGGGLAVAKIRSGKSGESVGKQTTSGKPSAKARAQSGTPEEQEEEKPQSTFRMIVWKNFGSTFFVGDAPRQVGARIEEITPAGAKIDRPDLTARIFICGSDTISVGAAHTSGRYKAASAEALPRRGETTYDGSIAFTFAGEGGTLVNNMTFHIKNEQSIMFAEEALTFIAGRRQTLAMPFAITGVNVPAGTAPVFEARITTANAPFAEVRIEQDSDFPQLWNALITETGIPQGQKEGLPAGSMETLNCQVKAYIPSANSEKLLEGSFEFYRFHEGIRLSVQHLRAYVTVDAASYSTTEANTFAARAAMNSLGAASGMGYLGLGGDSTAQVVGLGMGLDEDKAEMVVLPADPRNPQVNLGRASATVAFYTWDEKTGQVINPMPPIDARVRPGGTPEKGAVTFTFEDIPGSCNLKDKDGNDVSKPCETLGFFAFPSKLNRSSHNEAVFSIIPTKGLLMPPNRSQARVTVSLEWKGETYIAQETVNVISQPYRADAESRRTEYEKRDNHIFDRLTYIQKKILLTETTFERSFDGKRLVARNPYDGMMPVYHRIQTMLAGYDPEFGYYEPDYERIENLFNQYTTGALGSTAAADCAFYGRTLENSDALLMTVSDFNRSWMLVGARIGFALVTKGTSEGLFMAMQSEMSGFEAALKAADKGDDTLEIFRVGCSEAGKAALADAALGKLIEGGVAVAGASAKALCSTASKAKAALMQKLAKSFASAEHGAKVQSAAKALGGEVDDAAKAARELVERYGSGIEASKEMTQRDIAYCLGRIEGKIKVGNYAEALKDWKRLNRFDQYKLAFALQSDKHAMRAMMELEGEAANTLRAHFNAVVGEAEGKGLKLARVKIAGELKTDPKNIRIKKTSGNKSGELASGQKSSMDMDATFEQLVDGAWVDVPEALGQKHFNREMFKVVHGYEAASDDVAALFARAADLSIVDAAGLESYGTYADALRVIQTSRAAELFDDAARVGATAEYKCEHWFDLAQNAMKDADAARLKGDLAAAQALASASESFVEEASRQFVKQYDRIVLNKLGALRIFGINPEMTTFKKAAEVIRLTGIEKAGGITAAQVDVVLERGLNTNLKTVFHWLNEATVELDKQLQHL